MRLTAANFLVFFALPWTEIQKPHIFPKIPLTIAVSEERLEI